MGVDEEEIGCGRKSEGRSPTPCSVWDCWGEGYEKDGIF